MKTTLHTRSVHSTDCALLYCARNTKIWSFVITSTKAKSQPVLVCLRLIKHKPPPPPPSQSYAFATFPKNFSSSPSLPAYSTKIPVPKKNMFQIKGWRLSLKFLENDDINGVIESLAPDLCNKPTRVWCEEKRSKQSFCQSQRDPIWIGWVDCFSGLFYSLSLSSNGINNWDELGEDLFVWLATSLFCLWGFSIRLPCLVSESSDLAERELAENVMLLSFFLSLVLAWNKTMTRTTPSRDESTKA